MFAFIEGTIKYIGERQVIIETHGVGYKIFSPDPEISSLKIGEKASFWTYTAVRENSLDLYGFQKRESLEFFELLITISGIGPKSALSILNVALIDTLRHAIITGDPAHLTKVSGIGKKNAEKIVMELKDKVKGSANDFAGSTDEMDAIEALVALGYKDRDIREAIKTIEKKDHNTSDLVKKVLKILNK